MGGEPSSEGIEQTQDSCSGHGCFYFFLVVRAIRLEILQRKSESRIHLVLAENAHASTWCLVSGHYDAADQEIYKAAVIVVCSMNFSIYGALIIKSCHLRSFFKDPDRSNSIVKQRT